MSIGTSEPESRSQLPDFISAKKHDRDAATKVWDVIVIGAGLAGIMAARELSKEKLSVLVLESRAEAGGRARGLSVSEALDQYFSADVARRIRKRWGQDILGKRLQLGGYWFHGVGRKDHGKLDSNPFHGFALGEGFHGEKTYVDARRGQVFIGGRKASRSQVKEYLKDEERFIDSARRIQKKTGDVNAAQLLNWHGRFAKVIADELGPQDLAGDFKGASSEDATDFRSGDDMACKEGMDDLVKSLGSRLDIRTNAAVTEVRWGEKGVGVYLASKEMLLTRRVIVTVDLAKLKEKTIKFSPGLPEPKERAISELDMGLMNKTFLFFDKDVFSDFKPSSWCVVAEKCEDGTFKENAAVLVNADDLPFLAIVFTGGKFGRELEKKDDDARTKFALGKIAEIIKRKNAQKHFIAAFSTSWVKWNGGSYSFAKAGCADAHDRLGSRVSDKDGNGRLYFAGEACEGPKSGWGGSLAAAYVTGERAAKEVLAAHRSDKASYAHAEIPFAPIRE